MLCIHIYITYWGAGGSIDGETIESQEAQDIVKGFDLFLTTNQQTPDNVRYSVLFVFFYVKATHDIVMYSKLLHGKYGKNKIEILCIKFAAIILYRY